MNPTEKEMARCKELYRAGWTRQDLLKAGFSGTTVCWAIKRVEQSFRLPDERHPTKRCKRCGHKVYETFFVGGICQGCHTREVVNEQWKGRFRV